MRLPVDVMDLVRSGSAIQAERQKPVRIALFVEMDAPDALVDAAQRAFRAQTSGAYLHVEVAEPGVRLVVDPAADAVVGLVGSASPEFATSLAAARERAVPTAAVACAGVSADVADALGHPYRDTIANEDAIAAIELELGDWLVERLPAKRLALASNFAFMRRAVAVEHIKNTAFQNAVVGVVAIIPGADMPIMTANQAKMVMQIAAAYGEQLGAQRARELLAVVGGGFLLRTVARQAVALVPGFGWAVKGGIGYTGTIAMGYAAIRYFEGGADLGDLEQRLKAYGDRIAERLRGMSRREAEAIVEAEGLSAPQALPPALAESVLPPAEEPGRP